MAKRTKKTVAQQTSEQGETQCDPLDAKVRADAMHPAVKEHYHVEPAASVHHDEIAEDPGSLEEETLSKDAPYNQTYGRQG